jgi:hypothetical protein
MAFLGMIRKSLLKCCQVTIMVPHVEIVSEV